MSAANQALPPIQIIPSRLVANQPDSDRVILADAIVQAWEQSDVPFDKSHHIQLAMIAAAFLVSLEEPELP